MASSPPSAHPIFDAGDALAAVPIYPAVLTTSQVPEHLVRNPLVQLYLQISAEEEAVLAVLAASDAGEDESVAAALVASVR